MLAGGLFSAISIAAAISAAMSLSTSLEPLFIEVVGHEQVVGQEYRVA